MSGTTQIRGRSARIRRALLRWYRENQRDLPWRRTSDPYAVWVSEIMLQQTRVDTVRPYYKRFLARWPTAAALADADPEDVRAEWSGLGYYRRAKLMLDAAHVIARDDWPSGVGKLRDLPGFGRYTAGAVASIAFGEKTPAVDGNVMRVIARIEAIDGDVTRGEPNKQVWAFAETLARCSAPGDLNQGLIELGAQVCSVRNPGCKTCPVNSSCKAYAGDLTAAIPPPRKRAPKKRLDVTAIIATSGNEIVLAQQPDNGLLAGLWCPPIFEGTLDSAAASDEAERQFGWELHDLEDAGDIKHILTHREIRMRLISAHFRDAPKQLRRVDVRQLGTLGIPSVTSKALRAALPPQVLDVAVLRTRSKIGL